MPNYSPVHVKTGSFGSVLVTAANTSSQGGGTIGTDIFLVKTAGAEGTYCDVIRFIPTATTPTTTTGTVGRVFLSTQSSGATTSANTYLIAETVLPAWAADNASAPVPFIDVPIRRLINSGLSVLVTNHASPAANTAWRATFIGGDTG